MAAGRAIFVSFVACHLVAYVSAWGTVPTSLLVQQVEEQQKDIRLKPIDGRLSLPKADSSQMQRQQKMRMTLINEDVSPLRHLGKCVVGAGLSAAIFLSPSPSLAESSAAASGFPTTPDKPAAESPWGEFQKQLKEFQGGGGIKSFKVPDTGIIGEEAKKITEQAKAAAGKAAEQTKDLTKQGVQVPKMELPKDVQMPKMELPKELPKMPKMELPKELPKAPKDAKKPDDKPQRTSPAPAVVPKADDLKAMGKEKQGAAPSKGKETKFKVSDEVTVTENFESESDPVAMLEKGLKGKVLEIDGDGDALIKFEGSTGEQYVSKADFNKLSNRAQASKAGGPSPMPKKSATDKPQQKAEAEGAKIKCSDAASMQDMLKCV